MVTGRPLKVVFFGTPAFAVPTLRALIGSRHPVVVLVSQPDRPRGRGHQLVPTPTKALAESQGIPVLQPDRLRDPDFLDLLASMRPDIGVVAAYGKLLPDALLAVPPRGMINVHASLLPRWRGAAPVHRAVIAGDRETGVTIMRVVKELDAGPTLDSRKRAISTDETSPEVEQALAAIGAELLVDVIDRMAAGDVPERPQPDTGVTYAPKITKSEGSIDWHLPGEQIHNLVRGLLPWPVVSGRLHDARLLVHRTALSDKSAAGAAGSIVHSEGDRLEFAAGDGRVVRILSLQPEGRRVMSAREFLAGHPVKQGDRLERG